MPATATRPAAPTGQDTEQAQARALVAEVHRRDGVAALRNLTPLALQVELDPRYDPADVATLATRGALLQPSPSPLLHATLLTLGATRHGRRTYSVGLGTDANPRVAAAILDALPAGACYHGGVLDHLDGGTRLRDAVTSRTEVRDAIHTLVGDTPCGPEVLADTSARFDDWHRTEWGNGALVLTAANSRLYIRVCTQPGAVLYVPGVQLPGRNATELLDLDRLPVDPDLHRDPLAVTGADMFTILDAAAKVGWDAAEPPCQNALDTLRATARRSLIASPAPAAPGRAHVHVGADLLDDREPPLPGTITHTGSTMTRTTLPVGMLDELTLPAGTPRHYAPQVADLHAMATAIPAGRDGLRPYQDLAVSRYLATDTGYLLGLAPGLGKTVITLAGWQERAGATWRGLAVVPAPIRGQWAQEAAVWFPSCTVYDIRSGNDLDDLDLDQVDGPVLLVVSYHLAKDHLKWLTSRRWDDLCLDEAAFLKNAATQRSAALWSLREHVATTGGRALALTGTPIDRSVDDISVVVAWARGDRELFGRRKLSHQFPRLAHGEGLDAFAEVLGPALLRRDRSEISDELPPIETVPLLLTPTTAELALADGARYRLKEIYTDLGAQLDAQAARYPDDPRYAEAKTELAQARGAILGGVTLARMAASDPHTVAASDAAAAELLDADGLVAPATRQRGTKRAEIGAYIADLAAAGEAVLVFTDFATVAHNLVADLTDSGVSAGAMAGGTGGERSVSAFQYGDIDVLVATSAGREGLNLQRAGVLVHYDLPWVPSQIVQRIGRASRIGADISRPLQVVVPVMEGTIEQRVAAMLVPRAMTAIHALDGAGGSDLSATDIAVALRGIAGTAGEEVDALGEDASVFDVARAVIG